MSKIQCTTQPIYIKLFLYYKKLKFKALFENSNSGE